MTDVLSHKYINTTVGTDGPPETFMGTGRAEVSTIKQTRRRSGP